MLDAKMFSSQFVYIDPVTFIRKSTIDQVTCVKDEVDMGKKSLGFWARIFLGQPPAVKETLYSINVTTDKGIRTFSWHKQETRDKMYHLIIKALGLPTWESIDNG